MIFLENRDSCFLRLKDIKHELVQLSATNGAPAGAFFPPKIHLLFSINREPLFLCLRYIQTGLLGGLRHDFFQTASNGIRGWEFIPGSRRFGSRAAARHHLSTRAGGQDDVSSRQTPSNYVCRNESLPKYVFAEVTYFHPSIL